MLGSAHTLLAQGSSDSLILARHLPLCEFLSPSLSHPTIKWAHSGVLQMCPRGCRDWEGTRGDGADGALGPLPAPCTQPQVLPFVGFHCIRLHLQGKKPGTAPRWDSGIVAVNRSSAPLHRRPPEAGRRVPRWCVDSPETCEPLQTSAGSPGACRQS